ESGPTLSLAPKPFELFEHQFLMFGSDALAVVRDGEKGPVTPLAKIDLHPSALRRIPDGIADEVEQYLQGAPEFGDGRQAASFAGQQQFDAALLGSQRQYPACTPCHIRKVDLIGRRREVLVFDHLKVGQVVE